MVQRIAISTRSLTRNFGKVNAVNNLDLRIPEGVLFGLIGPNGAGKTTTLRMLAGLLEPTSGEIRINSLDLSQYWEEIRWQIGYMPDFFGVYEELQVWEYLDFFGRCYRIPSAHRRQITDELLELVDLSHKRNEFVHTLSRGMLQRLCLAHALVHDPKILILDEPASGLDPRARVEMRELLKELRSMGKTIILSSHILSELSELCDMVGIVDKGCIVASGSVENIRAQIQENRRVHLRVIDSGERAMPILENNPDVEMLEVRDNDFEFLIKEDDVVAAALLEELLAAGVKVTSFAPVSPSLEEVYLHLTSGDVN